MNSALYDCKVTHQRVKPLKHRFSYRYFSFLIDLDEVSQLNQKNCFYGYRSFNLFSFYEEDHLFYKSNQSLKKSIQDYLKEQKIDSDICKIYLLTNLRTLGYIFNPVSFYFCTDANNNPICILVEVNNTFKEMKPFILRPENFDGNFFTQRDKKYFYVSPFLNLTDDFCFKVEWLSSCFNISIDTHKEKELELTAHLVCQKKKLTNWAVFFSFLQFPFVPLKIIFAIHWQAFKLYLRGVPYHSKKENLNLQKGVYHVP